MPLAVVWEKFYSPKKPSRAQWEGEAADAMPSEDIAASPRKLEERAGQPTAKAKVARRRHRVNAHKNLPALPCLPARLSFSLSIPFRFVPP